MPTQTNSYWDDWTRALSGHWRSRANAVFWHLQVRTLFQMADIFISYARADREKIEKLAAALESAGLSIWWDRHITGGAEFSKDIEREIDAAKVVIAAWSEHANESAWVKDEASAGRDQGKLIPISLDDNNPPMGFRQFQAVNFSSWRGDDRASAFQNLTRAIGTHLKRDAPHVSMHRGHKEKAPGRTIAVLPFANISPDPEQEYFSDGIAEEVLNALTKIDDLHVAGRTSSFSFKGKRDDLHTIGEALKVAHILEGSVRKQGDRVRITAQLIKAEDGFHLWSETYDRELNDVFAIQEEIARSVADAFEVVLAGAKIAPLVKRATNNDEAYRLFLEGRALLARRIGDNLPSAIELFEQAISQDPNFARAYSALAAAHSLLPDYRRDIDVKEARFQGVRFARKAIELDTKLAEPLGVLSLAAYKDRRFIEWRTRMDQANSLDPNSSANIYWTSLGLGSLGAMRDAAEYGKRVIELDPVWALPHIALALCKLALNDKAEANRYAERARDLGHPASKYVLAQIAAGNGNADRASALLAETFLDGGLTTRFSEENIRVLTRGVFGHTIERDKARLVIESHVKFSDFKTDLLIPLVLLRIGDIERALSWFENHETPHDQMIYFEIWAPSGRAVRRHPAFQGFAKRVGFVNYWNEYSWPDLCRSIEGGDKGAFECD